MKKILGKILVASLIFTLTACGSKESKEVAKPKVQDEKLVIYSTHPENLIEAVASEFEKETGIEVDYINLKGALADRVLAEKDAPQADIMYGGASSLFIDLSKKDVFEKTTPSWAEDLNPLFKDPNGTWYGTIQTPVVMFYNSEMLSKGEVPKDWSDLIKPEYKNQLVFRDARSSSAKATYSSLLYQYEKEGKLSEGWEFMKALDANTKQYYGSGSLQFQAVGRKEASLSFAVLSSIIVNKEKGLPLEIINAESGLPVITDAIAVIKNAKHKDAAVKFLEFAGSAKIQSKLAVEFNRMPTLDAAIATSPKWMQEIKFKAMDVDWKVLSENQSDWMQKWDSEIKSNND